MPVIRLNAVLALCIAVSAQPAADKPAFLDADVHPTTISANRLYLRGPIMRGGRYEIRAATMVDLVSIAWSVNDDKVLGGPSWLELNRFDIVAKAPAGSTSDSLKPALQRLLAERFQLALHPENKPLPTFALVAGKKPLIKEADGSGETGCKPQAPAKSDSGPGAGIIVMGDGADSRIVLGPGMTIQYSCRNITMAQFAAGLPDMFTSEIGLNPILDRTGLAGRWNFDVKWSLGMLGMNAANGPDRISIFDAVDKQLGLKLEKVENSIPVIVVDRVNQQPTANAPDIAARLNVPPAPAEFEVAALKPAGEDRRGMFQRRVQPGNRVTIEGISVNNIILEAWNLTPEMLVNAPGWTNTDRYDLIAKVASPEQLDLDDIWPLCRKLLEERFALKTHMEERPVDAWRLVAVKPKLKKADPQSRTHSQNGPSAEGKDPRAGSPALTRVISFQNTTMAQFAEQLQRFAGGYIRTPIVDATGLEGGWDFTLAFSPAGMVGGRGGRGGRGAAPADASAANDAAEPTGALSLFEAIEKELGLKLEALKRPLPVLVVDSIERKPIEN